MEEKMKAIFRPFDDYEGPLPPATRVGNNPGIDVVFVGGAWFSKDGHRKVFIGPRNFQTINRYGLSRLYVDGVVRRQSGYDLGMR